MRSTHHDLERESNIIRRERATSTSLLPLQALLSAHDGWLSMRLSLRSWIETQIAILLALPL